MENKIPRRNIVNLFTPAELSIYNAMQEVEKTGADKKLTDAIILLQQAKDLVSDHVDEIECVHDYKCTLDTDFWSIYTCKKCNHTYIQDFD